LIFGVAIGLGMSSHDVVTLSTIARWFSARRGAMTGVVKIGTACGQILVPLAAALLISRLGWRHSFLVIGIIAMLVLLVAAQLMRRKPVELDESSATTELTGMSFDDIKRSRQFWILCTMQFTLFASLMAIPVHIVIHATDLGLSGTSAAAVLSVIGAVSILGRLVIGLGIDRLGCKRGYFICFIFLLASLILLRLISNPDLLFVFALVYGFSHGGFFTVVSPTIAEYFGMRAHGKAFGVVVFFGTLSGAVAPLLAGWIFDTYGSYDLAFSILAGLAASGLLLVSTMREPALPG
jgi:MFS family permease